MAENKIISLLARGGQATPRAPAKPEPKAPTQIEAVQKAIIEVALATLLAENNTKIEALQADLAAARQGIASAAEQLAGASTKAESLQTKLAAVLATNAGLRVELGNAQDRCAELETQCSAIERTGAERDAALLAAIAAIKPPMMQMAPPPGPPAPMPRYEIIPQGRDLNGRATGYDLIPVKDGK